MKLNVKVNKIYHTDSKTSYRIFKGTIINYELNENEKHLEMLIQKKMTFKGPAIYCVEGDTYTIDARLDTSKNNIALYIQNIELKKLELESEVENFLIKHINGVGKKTAKRILDEFGINAIETIKGVDGLEKLKKVVKSKKTATDIRDSIIHNANVFATMEFLQMHNLDVKMVNDILKEYEKGELFELKDDPYYFARAVEFNKLDAVASKNPNIKANDIKRLSAGIVAIVNANRGKGDVYTHIDDIYQNLESYLNTNGKFEAITLTANEIYEAIKYTIETEKLVIEDGEYIYIKYLRNKENDVAYHIKRLNKEDNSISTEEIIKHIEAFEKKNKVKVSDEQKEAVIKALRHGFSVLTGLPGAGKTFTVSILLNIYSQLYPNKIIRPLAPTGKAARRIQELTGIYAETVHRALCINENDPDEAKVMQGDFIIIDEASMLDIYLAGTLFSHIENGTKVLVVGDIEQLPSVGAGLILRDIIDSEVVPVTRLTKLYRQDEKSNIVRNAHAIAKENNDFCWKNDAIFWESDSPQDIQMKLLAGYKRLREMGNSMTNIAVLTQSNKSDFIGTVEINRIIQEKFNKNSKTIIADKETNSKLKENDLVMQIENNYDKLVFNGEIGVIESIELDDLDERYHKVYVRYSDRDEAVEYEYRELNQLSLAYCITIHKSQGSEFDNVIMIVDKQQEIMLNKNIIYTGITRAKKFLVVVGDEETFNRAIVNKEAISRLSNLKEKLRGKVFNKYAPIKKYEVNETFEVKTIKGETYTYTVTDCIIDEDEIF